MNLKKKILIGVTVLASIVYKVATKKIGPCSPELEVQINSKR